MTIKQLPAAPEARPCAGVQCDLLPKALEAWNPGLHAAEQEAENTISIYDPIGADFFGANLNGAAMLVYGGAYQGSQPLLLADARVEGNPSAQLGGVVGFGGDLTGNGSPDLLIGATGESTNGQGSGGVALISADWE